MLLRPVRWSWLHRGTMSLDRRMTSWFKRSHVGLVPFDIKFCCVIANHPGLIFCKIGCHCSSLTWSRGIVNVWARGQRQWICTRYLSSRDWLCVITVRSLIDWFRQKLARGHSRIWKEVRNFIFGSKNQLLKVLCKKKATQNFRYEKPKWNIFSTP